MAEKRMRTCIGCGEENPKAQMHRIVREPDGSISLDATGRRSGRGAYVCSSACFERACRKKKVGRALKTEFGSDEAARIASELEAAQMSAQAR